MKSRNSERPKVVIDTNVIISAPFSIDGNPVKIFELILSEKILNFTSEEIISEISEVFKRPKIKKYLSEESISFIITNYAKFSTLVKPKNKINFIPKDPDDNMILECAVEADASYIISGNDHLKEIMSYNGIRILSPKEFMNLYNSKL